MWRIEVVCVRVVMKARMEAKVDMSSWRTVMRELSIPVAVIILALAASPLESVRTARMR